MQSVCCRERVEASRSSLPSSSGGGHISRQSLNKSYAASLVIGAEMPPAMAPSPEEPSMSSMSGSSLKQRRVDPIPFTLTGSVEAWGSANDHSLPPIGSSTALLNSGKSLHSQSLPSMRSGSSTRRGKSAPSSSLKHSLADNPLAKVTAAGAKLGQKSLTSSAIAATLKKTMKGLGAGNAPGVPRAEHAVEKRMDPAMWSNPDKMAGPENGLRSLSQQHLELQGPTNWASDDLCCKYRSEDIRETAWQAYLLTREEAERREREEGIVLPVASVDRHPIFVCADNYVESENARARRRARARNKMKVFVLDVHRIWETNLEFVTPEEHVESSLKGLSARRDVTAIEQGRSQVQSVSTVRALAGALDRLTVEEEREQTQPRVNLVEKDDNVEVGFIPEIPDAEEHQLPPEFELLVKDSPVVLNGKEVLMMVHHLEREGEEPLVRFTAYDYFTGLFYRAVLPRVFVDQMSVSPGRLPSPTAGFGRVVHRQGFRKKGTQMIVEVRVAGQDGHVVLLIQAYTRAIGSAATQAQLLVHAMAEEVAEALEVTSLRFMTYAWWCERARVSLWREIIDHVDIKEGKVLLPLKLKGKREEPSFYNKLAKLITLEPAASGKLELKFAGSKTVEADGGERWEEEAVPRERVPPTSVQVCGRDQFLQVVPGTTTVGKLGLGKMLHYPQDEEHTQAAAMYVRDPALSSTNSVLVTLDLALDTAVLVPLLIAWLWQESVPPPVLEPWPPVKTVIPRILAEPTTLKANPVESILDVLVPVSCLVQCDAEDPLDYLQDKLKSKLEGRKAAGHRRLWEEHNQYFFRQWAKKNMFDPDPVVSPRVFGVTSRGAQPNAAGTLGRHNWHSEQRCVETLCKRRVEKDYAYISHNKHHQGINDPNTYSCLMQHEVIRELEASRLLDYLREHRRLREQAAMFAEAEILKAKIEAGKAALAAKRKEQERIEAQLNAKESKKARKREGKGKGKGNSLQEWARRVQKSHLLREWGDWQERKDEETGSIFYQNTDEQTQEPFQWDPPGDWPFEANARAVESSDDEDEYEESDTGGEGGADGNGAMTMESIIDQLSTNQAFLEMISVKLGLTKKDDDDDMGERVVLSDSSEEEDSENDDEEGGRSHQHGSGAAPKNLQQHHGDRRRARNDQIASEGEAGVPPLALDRMKANKGKGWKRLKKAFTTGLVGKATSTHIQGAKVRRVGLIQMLSEM